MAESVAGEFKSDWETLVQIQRRAGSPSNGRMMNSTSLIQLAPATSNHSESPAAYNLCHWSSAVGSCDFL